MLFIRKVKAGSKTGQKIGFPTINLNVGNFSGDYKEGVYKCNVYIGSKEYTGALYYGPKMHHKGNILEIYIMGFSKRIYGQFIKFKIVRKIRIPKVFKELNELKKQIEIDLKDMI